jgi:hypothetical protein
MSNPRRTVIALFAWLALVAVPGWSYTIYLKDGSKLIAKEKYVVRGDKAIIYLESGAETMLPVGEIDAPRTEAANVSNLGTAVVIEDGKAQDLSRNSAPPPRKQTLQDLIQSRGAQPGAEATAVAAPPTRRARSEGTTQPGSDVVGRAPLRNVELAGKIREYLFGRGISSVEVLQGSSSLRPMLVYPTSTEGQVFKAIAASASALIHVRDKSPGDVDSFEIICRAPDGGNAGRFVMSPPQAQDLLASRIDLPTYYVRYVIF